MKARCLILAAAALGLPRGASALEAPPGLAKDGYGEGTPVDAAPGAFNGIGSPGRTWSFENDFGTDKKTGTVADRVEIARALAVSPSQRVHLVLRVAAAAAGEPGAGPVLRAPLFSAGFRVRTENNRHAFEGGLRLIPPWPAGINDNAPNTVALGLDATLASGLADDAQWLSFTDTGAQAYADISTRTGPARCPLMIMGGLRGGGVVSLAPMQVRTWLGPQTAMIGNVYFEGFLDFTRAHWTSASGASTDVDLNLQLGLRGVASLSNIWPGTAPLPVGGYFFVGWSPKSSFAIRVFAGAAGSPQGTTLPLRWPFGARVEFYLP